MEIVISEISLGVIAFTAITYLGFLIYLKDTQSWTNRFFILLTLILDIYIAVNYLSLHPPLKTLENQLFWIRVVMFTAAFFGPALFFLVHTFPGRKITLRRGYFAAIMLLATLSAVSSLTPLIFKSIQYLDGEPIPVPGPGIAIFWINFFGLLILSLVVLFRKYRKAIQVRRAQYLYLLLGVFFSFSLMGISTIVSVVVFKESFAVFMGPIFPVILIALLYYAIVKHQLFNIRILATETFTLIIGLIFLINVVTSDDLREFIFNLALFGAVVTFGIFLIRGTLREMRELERLSQAKSEFVSIASHQLRTPLTAIKGFISMVKEGSGTEADRKRWLNNAYVSNERLIRLVEDLLNISRIERGKIRYSYRRTNVVRVIDSIIREFEVLRINKEVELKWEIPKSSIPAIQADPEKLRQVFINLIDNALKYTKKGWVSVRIEHLKELKKIRVAVQDTGIGISEKDMLNMFGIFSRGGEGQKTNVEGLGVGLYVAREMVKAHQGKIWAESDGPNKGTTFYVELPTKAE